MIPFLSAFDLLLAVAVVALTALPAVGLFLLARAQRSPASVEIDAGVLEPTAPAAEAPLAAA